MIMFDLLALWEEAQQRIRDKVSQVAYKAWIEPIRPIQVSGILMLLVQTDFQKEIIENRYSSLISNTLRTIAGKDVVFRIINESNQDEVACIEGSDHVAKREVQLWQRALELLKDELQELSINTWLKTIEPVKLNDKLVLRVPDEFSLEIVELRYIPLIEASLEIAAGHEIKCEFVVGKENVAVLEKWALCKAPSISSVENKASEEITMKKLLSEMEQMRQEMSEMQGRLRKLEAKTE